MPAIDLPLEQLQHYRSSAVAPDDFDQAWADTLAQARTVRTAATAEPVDNGLQLVDSFDVTFPGFAGDPVRAWLTVPAGAGRPLPVVVQYNGYNGGRGLPSEHLLWANAGFAHLFMDTRGQGSGWGSGGDTDDPHGGGPAVAGWMTRGAASFETSYFRRLVTDAVRAVDAARTLPQVDPDRVTVTGISQGGGLTLAVAGLVDGLVAAMPDVPFLCDIARGVQITPKDPYNEVARYLASHREKAAPVLRTLSYVDGVHHAARASAPALFSVALWDDVCPPSTVYGAFHAYAGSKDIEIYPYNKHEGGQHHQVRRQVTWLRDLLGV